MGIEREPSAARCVLPPERPLAPTGEHSRPQAATTPLSSLRAARRTAARATGAAHLSLSSDPGLRRARAAVPVRGFTLLELLVVIGVVALLSGLLAPALHGARRAAMETVGGAQTREIGSATLAYMRDHDGRLPQLRLTPRGEITDDPSGLRLAWLFGGGRSIVNVFEASRVGADARPLNAYLGDFAPDARPEIFRDPLDGGTRDDQLTGFAPDRTHATVSDLVGTSYVLNDHALDEVPCPFVELFGTLVPTDGGRTPEVETPSRTWLAGQSPIYNYDDGGDKGELWGRDRVRASLCFVDGHVEIAAPVAPGIVNTTEHYTFFPRPGWGERFEHLRTRSHD